MLNLCEAYVEIKRGNGDGINSLPKLKRAEFNATQYENKHSD